jgi:alpha-ketoglutarate-dependent 2,4-dichlorophenoxyacetate dioxygenase
MAWTERKLTPKIGLALEGFRVDEGLTEAERARIRAAIYQNGVVLLPGQSLDDDAFYAFAEAIGEVVLPPSVSGVPPNRVLALTNLDENGHLRPADDVWVKRNQQNTLWHADLTFMRPRAAIGMLYGRTVVSDGGNTEICDMRLAWESLSPAEQAELEPLVARHSLWLSRRKYGTDKGFSFSDEDIRRYPPVERPLVDIHRPTGRKALMLGANIASVGELDEIESVAFLDELTERATAPEFIYSHRWTAGELLLWDNRCTMHRVSPYDTATQPRDMRAIRLFEAADA